LGFGGHHHFIDAGPIDSFHKKIAPSPAQLFVYLI
jgi:hypothetical protein